MVQLVATLALLISDNANYTVEKIISFFFSFLMGFTLMFEGEWLLFIELHIKEDFHPGSFSLSLSLPLSGTTHPKGNLKHLD